MWTVIVSLQINVYELGKAYLTLAKALHIKPPAIGSVEMKSICSLFFLFV